MCPELSISVPELPIRYQQTVRSFGLFGPCAAGQNRDAVFAVLGQDRMPTPTTRQWIARDFDLLKPILERVREQGFDLLTNSRSEVNFVFPID